MKTKEVIKELLMNHPKLRDSDNNLISTYWFKELQLKGIDTKNITAFELLKMYADSKLTNAETIRRMRAKLQEDYDSLRGEKYNLRKGVLQENFRKELGYK
jgi:hypothetical protein